MMTNASKIPPREELERNYCAYCHQEGHWKNEYSQMARDSLNDSQTRGRGQVVEGKYQPSHRGASPREENIVSLVGLEGYKED
jgi:hypothetical protein